MTKQKNKIRFCWICSRKLRGNHYKKIKLRFDGMATDGFLAIGYVCHKSCADIVLKESRNQFKEVEE